MSISSICHRLSLVPLLALLMSCAALPGHCSLRLSAGQDSSLFTLHSSLPPSGKGSVLRADSVMVAAMREEGVTFSHDNTITLLMNGQQKFDDMFAAIRQARHSIHLEYFNFRNDSIASLLFDLLAEKVKQGVKVRALYDAFGNSSNNRPLRKSHVSALRQRGIDIYEFDPIRFPWVNHIFGRDHRKIVIIDGRIAYTGGMNVADYYIKGTPEVGDWRDMHCRIEGTEVNTLQTIFRRAWYYVTDELFNGDEYFQGTEYARQLRAHSTLPAHVPEASASDADSSLFTLHSSLSMAGIVNREPYRTPRAVRQFYISAIDAANDTIRIVNPYFSLIPSVKRALKRALKRGVEVQLMLAEPSDIPLTPDCAFYNAHKLQKRGCKVWIYQPGFHHTKIITVDGQFCTVGSTNLDSRSLRCDYEENVIIVDSRVTAQLDRMFNRDKADSFVLTEQKWKEWRTPWQRFRSWFANILSPFL